MFCPVCGYEYREGFTICSDCQVDLVLELPRKDAGGRIGDGDAFALVWSGADARVHADVCEALEREHIPARTLQEQDHLVYASYSPPFQVYVPAEFAAKAQEILGASDSPDKSMEQLAESGALELPAEPEDTREERATDYTRSRRPNIDPESAIAPIWSGDNADIAAMIEASLRENAIFFRTESAAAVEGQSSAAAGSKEIATIFVLPEDEARAGQIVDEIVDAAAP